MYLSKNKIAFESHPPKRTRIGDGRRVRTRLDQGRTKRSPSRTTYRGQGK